MSFEDIEITELNLRQRIAYEKRLEPLFTELAGIAARKTRRGYEELVKQGFSRKQALDIVKSSQIFDSGFYLPDDNEYPANEERDL